MQKPRQKESMKKFKGDQLRFKQSVMDSWTDNHESDSESSSAQDANESFTKKLENASQQDNGAMESGRSAHIVDATQIPNDETKSKDSTMVDAPASDVNPKKVGKTTMESGRSAHTDDVGHSHREKGQSTDGVSKELGAPSLPLHSEYGEHMGTTRGEQQLPETAESAGGHPRQIGKREASVSSKKSQSGENSTTEPTPTNTEGTTGIVGDAMSMTTKR